MNRYYNKDEPTQYPLMEEISQSTLMELPPPASLDYILRSQIERGYKHQFFLNHSFIKDGLMVRGIELSSKENFEFFRTLLNDILATINKVEDEHLKSLGTISAGFLRFLEIDARKISSSSHPWDQLTLRLFFRFTTDQCPAGLRMIRRIRSFIEDLFVSQPTLGIRRFALECFHGGTPWSLDDVNDKLQQSILAELLSIVKQNEIAHIPINFYE